eukprot:515013_1
MKAKPIDIGIYCYFGLCFISFVIVMNWTITFYKLQKTNVYLNARRPKIILTMGIVSCIGLSIERIHGMLFTLSYISDHITTVYWKTTQTLMTHFTLILLQYLFLIRAWLTYYDIKFNQALQDSQWRVGIDPSEAKKSWIINHRSTFGNPKYILIICLSTCSLFGITATAYVWFNGDFDIVSRALIGTNAFLPLIINIIILIKLPIFYDIWKLRKEVKICVYSQCIVLITFLLYTPIINPQPEHWAYLPLNVLGIIAYLCGDYIIFQWVFMQFKLPYNIYQLYIAHKKGIFQFDLPTRSKIKMKEQQKSIGKFVTLPDEEKFERKLNKNKSAIDHTFQVKVKQRRNSVQLASIENREQCSLRGILQNAEGIKLFARHIALEFAIENFLMFFETQLYLDQLHSHPIYGTQIKLLHTEKCGLSVYQQTNINNRLGLINQQSSTGSHSSNNNSPIGLMADLIEPNDINQQSRAASSSLSKSAQSISHKSSFMYDNSKYIHLKFPTNIPISRIISSGYKKKIIKSTDKKYMIGGNINTTPTDSGNNIVVPVTPSLLPYQVKKSPSLLPYNPSPYQPTLQLSPLDSDKQCTKDEYHMYGDNSKPLPLENNDTGTSNTTTYTGSTRKTRSHTKSTTKSTTYGNNYVTNTNTNTNSNTVTGNTFPDIMDEIQELEP